jgi:Flp pilus assembly protein TadG
MLNPLTLVSAEVQSAQASPMHAFFRTLSRFRHDQRGNIAVIFTIAILPMLLAVGCAIDYSRVSRALSSMQAALDSTALMVSKDLSSGVITTANISTAAQAYFKALYTDSEAQSITINATYTAANGSLGSTVQVTGSANVKTDFMQIVGYPQMNFSTSSTAAWGNARMRVALALDNTGSMADNGKIGALRTAASNLIDQLSALAKNPGDVYISVVPFAKVVNVGTNYSSAAWIDQTDWLNPPTAQPANVPNQATLPMNWHAVGPGSACPFTTNFTCTSGPANYSSPASGSTIPSSGTYTGYICPSVDSNSQTLYNGCWESKATGDTNTVFCSGSSSCSCPNGTGSTCSCNGNGSSKSCKGTIYTHNWTQPGPNDTTHNMNQPRVSAPVGFLNNAWTPTNSTPTVPNNWTQASTNPFVSTWNGCITDRTQNYDITSDAATQGVTATLFPANQYFENASSNNPTSYCDPSNSTPLEPIIPMTSSWGTLKSAINTMQPTGGTNQAIGLAWAWQSLLTTSPLPAPAEDPNYTYNRVIILLSDGLNTEDRWPANGNGRTQNLNAQNVGLIDLRQAALCQNIKNATDPTTSKPMYTIYTIQVNTSSPADPTSTVLQNCASSPDKFFMLTSSSQIVTTFNSIGTALSKLRVAR